MDKDNKLYRVANLSTGEEIEIKNADYKDLLMLQEVIKSNCKTECLKGCQSKNIYFTCKNKRTQKNEEIHLCSILITLKK